MMKADARSSAEKEALEWATDFFRNHANGMTREGSRQRMIEPDWDGKDVVALDGLVAHALFDGSEVIAQKLCNIAADLIERGEQLPDTLKLFTVTFLRYPGMKWKLEDEPKRLTAIEEGRRSPGPDQNDLTWRNACIAVAISEIVKLWKLPATRNNATADSNGRASGASIVREAIEKGANIHLTEAAINKIWLTRSSEELATNE